MAIVVLLLCARVIEFICIPIVVLLLCARVIEFICIPRTPNQVHFWESCADLVLD